MIFFYVVRPVVIAVGVRHNCQSGKVVSRSEDGTGKHPISGVPECESVSEQILGGTGHFELDLHLPVSHVNRLNITK